MIKFLFFAQLAELAEQQSLELEFQPGDCANDYMNTLAEHVSKPAIDLLSDGATMLSINHKLASWNDELSDGDEIGLLPPFSGG